jgi:GMP synthase-like glutamine amidotransferase
VKPVAIVQNAHNDGPSFFATWLSSQGIWYQTFRMFEGAALAPDITAHGGLCVLGGAMSANDALPYFPALRAQIRQAIALDIPVIGHCLGGQLMSQTLGASVQAAEHMEIGWSQLQAVHPRAQQWFGPGPEYQLFQWHSESFSVPEGATPLLSGIYCTNQAYVVQDRHLAMQFHCEMDAIKVREWLVSGKEEMESSDSPAVMSRQALLETLDADLQQSQALASRIYARWAQGLQSS